MNAVFLLFVLCTLRDVISAANNTAKKLSHESSLPSVFIIGAMKAGTTSLSQIFRAHDEFCHDNLKEKNFFSFDQNYKHGKQWYIKTFPDCGASVTLDATPTYFSDPETPKRLKEFFSPQELRRKKFVLILREPVSRLYSEYQFRHRGCLRYLKSHPSSSTTDHMQSPFCMRMLPDTYTKSKKPSVDISTIDYKRSYAITILHANAPDTYTKSKKPFVDISTATMEQLAKQLLDFPSFLQVDHGLTAMKRSDYHEHWARWLEVVRRDQLFVVNFKTLISQSNDVLSRLRVFLHLESDWSANTTLPKPISHVDYDSGMSCDLRAQLVKRYEREGPQLAKDISAGLINKLEPPFPAFDPALEAPPCIKSRPKIPSSSSSNSSTPSPGNSKQKKTQPSSSPTKLVK
eukprot:CAMPEP_0201113402 /NCGR_PEP_ID=MMETSP0812-20130820/77827_1 /ASSEMBLY_ACC=CAM_ASM_000668 /TAXON_ID=98059 /ORGANISM="Dinobryon sp., Strain UTEXLB2267" /LENGTH=402 /DNA_ID=CAMNT_0047376933 /DNA_START=73 /DNA_END=1282 /DNA_ORIENTATION=+